MATKKKEIFFVRETPDNYNFDITKAKQISSAEIERIRKAGKKKRCKAA